MLRVRAEGSKGRKERLAGLTGSIHARLIMQANQKGRGVPLMPKLHRRSFETAREAIDCHQPITLRDLRHCYAILSAQGTGDAAATQSALGHSRLSTTQRRLTATLSRTAPPLAHRSEGAGGETKKPRRGGGVSDDHFSGGRRTRTDDILRAKQTLSQLSYTPV